MGSRRARKQVPLDVDAVLDDTVEDAPTRRLRPVGRPTAGPRLALSYALTFAACLVGMPIGTAVATSLYNGRAVCANDESLGCPVFLTVGLAGGLTLLLLALAAWWCRTGWAWVVALAGLSLLLVEVVGDPFSPWILTCLAIPAIASVATDPGLPRLRARTLAVVAVALGAVGYLFWVVQRVRGSA